MTLARTIGVTVLSLVMIAAITAPADAQLKPPEVKGLRGAPFPSGVAGAVDVRSWGEGPAFDGKVPDGITPLPMDVFSTKDFYKDKALWMDQRYWRCNSPRMMADLRSGGAGTSTVDPRIGAKPPLSARWGDCKMDWPRENIVSPYAFKTAREHYDALMADAKKRGGPTKHTYETMPKWDGTYGEAAPNGVRIWNYSRGNQVPTLLSLLTPEYQQRMVRQVYHEGINAAHQWSASYCWPEGFMRQWATGPKPNRIVVTPEVVLLLSSSMERSIQLNREPPRDGTRQWYGESVGFWDGDALIAYTKNIQGWNQHSSWEWSDDLEAVDIVTPVKDAAGKLIGLDWETVLYDPQALAQPVRILMHKNYQQSLSVAGGIGWSLCTNPLYTIDGVARPVAPGEVVQYRVPDMQDRPWAKNWEIFEKNMSAPKKELDLGFK